MKDCEHTFRPKVGFNIIEIYFCMWCGIEKTGADLAHSKQIYF